MDGFSVVSQLFVITQPVDWHQDRQQCSLCLALDCLQDVWDQKKLNMET